ncbi:MAG: thiamine-phosphate kinase [Rhodospirillaceae bacterium]
MSGISEFELIDQLLKPLTNGISGAFALSDDAATLGSLGAGQVHVVTKDALAVGVHMLADDPPGDIARKALRVNLSDLAAMGAIPSGFFMALCLGQDTNEKFIRGFVRGLAKDSIRFEIPLLGGDVVRHSGPFLVTITAVGTATEVELLRRSGAQIGDGLWVSGSIGDSALGLLAATDKLQIVSDQYRSDLIQRYRVPKPRIALGQALAGVANACIDISDGLIADVGHLCSESGLMCHLNADNIPLSSQVRSVISFEPSLLSTIMNGGDDYELAFAVSGGHEDTLKRIAKSLDVQITKIGLFCEGKGVEVVGENCASIAIARNGYQHL